MADGHFPTLVSKDRDANSLSNPMLIELSDGTNALHKVVDAVAGTDAGVAALAVRDDALTALTPADGDYVQLRVNANGALWVEDVNASSGGQQYAEDAAHASGDLGNVALVVRKDTIASNVGADGDYATLLQDANGRLYVQIHDGGNSITVDGAVTVSATDLDIRDLTHVSDSVKVGDGTDFLAIDGSGNIGVTDAGGSLTVDASDLDIRDLTLALDAVKVSGNASANGPLNPIYVQVVSTGVLGNEIHSYDTTSAVASDTGDNHDYTVTGANFLLKSVIFAASGGMKVEVQVGPVAVLVTKAVAFINKEGGFGQLFFDPPIEVPVTGTGTVRVIRTNRQGAAQDVYSTIIGDDVA